MEPPNQEGRAPWILPVKLNKISSGQRFSKYRHLDESRFFLLQKRKRPFRSQRNPTFRIITNQHPFYEVANADDLNLLRAKCWGCIINGTYTPPNAALFLAAYSRRSICINIQMLLFESQIF